jgi:hypothetical protein
MIFEYTVISYKIWDDPCLSQPAPSHVAFLPEDFMYYILGIPPGYEAGHYKALWDSETAHRLQS